MIGNLHGTASRATATRWAWLGALSFAVATVPALAAAQASPVVARDAWVREAPAGRAVTAVFLMLQNAGTTARTLVSGRASVGDTLELHEMKRENGMMRMAPVTGIAIPAGASVELRPGGLHLMLFGLKKPLTVGDTVRVQLTLDDKTTVEVAAPVRRMGGM
ncbi:copper chaperone PCu(A)C [Gemmatimonas sp.]